MFTRLFITNPNIIIDTAIPEGYYQADSRYNYPNLLCENPTYTHCINSDENLEPGQASSAQLTFVVDYTGYSGTKINKNSVITFWTQQTCDNGVYRRMGVFRVDEITKNRDKYTIVCYDNIIKFDKDVSDFLNTTQATTLFGLFDDLCTNCGVTRYNTGFRVNGDMAVTPKELIKTGISGRTVLQYIAQAVGCYAYARDDGKIHIDVYGNLNSTPTVSVTNADYDDLDMAELDCPRITSVAMNNQTEIVYGRGSSTAEVQIIYNPLFYTKDPATIQPYVQNIYNELNRIGPYRACTFHMFNDKKINAGDLISVDGQRVIVFNKTLNDSGCTITCTGTAVRLPQVITSQQMIDRQEAYSDNGVDIQYINKYVDFTSSKVYFDDIYMSGIGYDGNPYNNSLLNVINYLLIQGGYKTTPTVDYGVATMWGYPTIHTNYETSVYGASITSGSSVSIDGTGQYWKYTAETIGQSEITFTQSVGGIDYPVIKLKVDVYHDIYPAGVTQLIPYYYTRTTYDNIKLKAYWGGNPWVLVGDSDDNPPSGYINNDSVMWEFADDNLNLELRVNGPYKIEVYDKADHLEAIWYLSSSIRG